jgi:hypothetical protein
MNTPDPNIASKPAIAVPWYRSRIIVGIATIVASRLLDYAQKRWHFDAALFGVSVTDLTSLILDGIAGVAAYVALHARIAPTIPIPPVVTLTQTAADQANTAPLFSPKETPK